MAVQRPFGGVGGQSSLFVGTFTSRSALAAAQPSPATGSYAFVGASNPKALLYYNGASWVPMSQSLAHSAVAVPLTGTTNITPLATIKVPGGIMGPNGAIRVNFRATFNNNANYKNFYALWGASQTQFYNAGANNSDGLSGQLVIENQGSASSQVLNGTNTYTSYGVITPVATASENTDNDTNIVLSANLSVTTDTLSLRSYNVELVA